MRSWRAGAGLMAIGLMLLGCGSGGAEPAGVSSPASVSRSVERSDRNAPPSSPTVRPSKPGRAQPTDHAQRPPLRVLVATLRDAGATSVGEAEPSHGSNFQILSGVFDQTLIVATGARIGTGLFDGLHEVSRSGQDGTIVRLMRDETGGLHTGFRRDGIAWLFRILDDDVSEPVRLLMSLASAVADAC